MYIEVFASVSAAGATEFGSSSFALKGCVAACSRHGKTAPDPGIFYRGGSPLAVIYSITNFLFQNETIQIIEPHLLEKRGF